MTKRNAAAENPGLRPPTSSRFLKNLARTLFMDPYRRSMPYRVLQILFAVKLMVILPFVNLPSFFRITQQISDASNPLDAEPLSGGWIISLGAYIFLNCCGFFGSVLLKVRQSLLLSFFTLSVVFESLLSFFYSYLFDSGASLSSALGPLSMTIMCYRLLLGYRFGIFQTILTLGCTISLYLGQTLGDWPSAPILSEPQLSPTFSVFDLNALFSWYICVAVGSNAVANIIGSLHARIEAAHDELKSLNQYVTESVLKRYLPPALIEEILAGRLSMDSAAESRFITIMFTDLKGFTSASEELGPERIAQFLNDYLSEMNAIIFKHNGTVDKFIGDAVMVVFGAPAKLDKYEQAQRAVACGLEMQSRMPFITKAWEDAGVDALEMRIGIHQGDAIVGNFGSTERSDYTCIGPAVNLAARIETSCAPGEVFVSPTMKESLDETFVIESAGQFQLKGIGGEIELFKVGSAPKPSL